jgi:hypothetical protein
MGDPQKLKAFIDKDQQDESDGQGDQGDQGDGDPDDEQDTSEEAQNQRKMNPEVSYMELDQEAGAFACGECIHVHPGEEDGEGSCIHKLVRAKVSTKNGSCDLYSPAEANIVFPPGEGGAEDEEDEELDEEDESEDEDEEYDEDEDEG